MTIKNLIEAVEIAVTTAVEAFLNIVPIVMKRRGRWTDRAPPVPAHYHTSGDKSVHLLIRWACESWQPEPIKHPIAYMYLSDIW